MSQCIPGIIAGNIAICTGYKIRGIIGAIAAILGIITSPFICIILLANILNGITEIEIIKNAFWGTRISVTVLIIITIKDIWKSSVNSVFTYILYLIILTALIFLPISPAIIIISAALIALIYGKVRSKNV